MATARQHHYVQARYLDGFLRPGCTQLVCSGRGRFKPHRSIPDGIATQRNFYAIPNGSPDANIENFLETKIERPGLDALRRLVQNRTAPSVEDRVSLSRYIAFQEMRIPYSRELNREHIRQSFEEKALQFEKSGKSSLIFQNVALAEGIPVKRSEPYEVTREEVEEFLADINNNPDTDFTLNDSEGERLETIIEATIVANARIQLGSSQNVHWRFGNNCGWAKTKNTQLLGQHKKQTISNPY